MVSEPSNSKGCASTMANPNPTADMELKLLIDKKGQRVLFAEAGKDFVDFLFTIPTLPFSTVFTLLKSHEKDMAAGSLINIYRSIESFDDKHMEKSIDKHTLLKPDTDAINHLLLSKDGTSMPGTKTMYACEGNNKNNYGMFCGHGQNVYSGRVYCSHVTKDKVYCSYVTNDKFNKCPRCDNQMTREVTYLPSSRYTKNLGYVKGFVTYTIMDDLEVKPMSTISSLTMLSSFNIKDIDHLEEKTVFFGANEGLELMKAALETKTVLTEVFLKKKKKKQKSPDEDVSSESMVVDEKTDKYWFYNMKNA